MQKSVFEKITLCNGRVSAPNRTMRSATWEWLAGPGGEMTPELAEMMLNLARHHVGIISFSHCFVAESGCACTKQLGIETDAAAESYRQVVSEVKALGSVPMVQLAHGGRYAITGDPVDPSGLELTGVNGQPLPKCREATREDIEKIVKAFAAAAVRAKAVGFEIIMVHSAHCYLLSQFLSPMYNRRTDEYGGSLENRARLLLTVVREVKKAVGDDFPVAVKLNTEDTFPDGAGLSIEESAQVAAWLAEAGVCLVEASGGGFGARFSASRTGKTAPEGYHKEGARLWKKAIKEAGFEGKTLVALVGGIRSRKAAEGFLNDGTCDIVSISRPLIREPDLVDKWLEDPEYCAKCVACNGCFRVEKFGCAFNQKKEKKEEKN